MFMPVSLEVHIPISPTPMFLRQTWALAASLRQFGGAVGRSATLTAWVSPELPGLPDLNRLHPWAKTLGVTFRWVDEALFARHWYYGTALARWAGPFSADVVMMLDADVLVCNPLDALVQTLAASTAVWGLPAHVSPFSEQEWRALFASAGLPEPALDCRPSGVGILPEVQAQGMPPYFNLGVIAAPRAVMQTLGQGLLDEMERVNAFVQTYYRCQVAIPLGIARHGLPWRALDVRDNFPNDAAFERAHPHELGSIRLLHYLRENEAVSKKRDFATAQAYAALLQRQGLTGVNALLQSRLRGLPACALDASPSLWRRALQALLPSAT